MSKYPRDKRSHEMKKILQSKYPGAKFKVRTDKFSMGEAFDIYTDLIEQLDHKPQYMCSSEEWHKQQERFHKQRDMVHEIETLLKNYWHVDRCSITGEILSGGNTYLSIHPIERAEWL